MLKQEKITTFYCTNFWQLWQILVTPLTVGRDVVRQVVEQKSSGEPFLWKAVCPFIRLFLQLEQDMCKDDGLTVGSVCVSVAGVTEKTDPILKSSCQPENSATEVSDGPVILDPLRRKNC